MDGKRREKKEGREVLFIVEMRTLVDNNLNHHRGFWPSYLLMQTNLGELK